MTSVLGDTKRAVADAAFQRLLEKLHPSLAIKVKEKYDKDYEEFLAAVQENTPNKDPGYWAKSGCKRCNGLGISGKLNQFASNKSAKSDGERGYANAIAKHDIPCRCTYTRYGSWLKEFRTEFNAFKEQTKGDNNGEE